MLTEHLSVYFRYFDSDYKDLKKLLNIEPLQISILPYKTIESFEEKQGMKMSRINPDPLWLKAMLGGAKTAQYTEERA